MTDEVEWPEIVDAIRDQSDRRWIIVRGALSKEPTCFPVDELATGGSAIFVRLSRAGTDVFSAKKKERFKDRAANHKDYRSGLSASGPGWIGEAFVTGDGRVFKKCHDEGLVVGFDPDMRFSSHGDLASTLKSLDPFVRGQHLPRFLLAYSLAPALLRFAPPDVGNPLLEIVGGTGTGKTTAGVFAMATWAGDPQSNVGGGTSWNRTLKTLDAEKMRQNAMMLFVDETNHIDDDNRAKALKEAVFALEGTGSRVRYGDALPPQHSRFATLSSSNVPLADILKGKAEDKKAVASRMLTILLGTDRHHGIFDRCPDGFASAEAAAVAFRASSNDNYAVLGPAFVEALIARGPKEVQLIFDQMYGRALADVSVFEELSPRHRKTLAPTIVAWQMAVRLGVVPRAWGDILEAVSSVRGMIVVEGDIGRAARQAIQGYVDAHARDLRRVEDLAAPLSLSEVRQAPGFISQIDGEPYLLINPERFAREFADDSRDFLRSLKAANRLKFEGEKYVIKPPNALSKEGRVYCIRLERDVPRRSRIVLPRGFVPYTQRLTAPAV